MSQAISKRQKELAKLVEKGKSYSLKEAVAVLRKGPKTKFDASVSCMG